MSDMVIDLINDMNKALDTECYFAALAIALMLPDICGKAEYPEEKSVKKRYIQWYEECIGQYEKFPDRNNDELKTPYLSGEVVYQLRNSFLHQGTPNINKEKIDSTENKIDKFVLVIEEKNELDMYWDSAGVDVKTIRRKKDDNTDENETIYIREYEVNVRRLCFVVGTVAKGYYEQNKEKFDFLDCKIKYRHKRPAYYNIQDKSK